MIHVTAHAAQRYCERIDPSATIEQATAAIAASESAIVTAAGFGCSTVVQGSGAKLILSGETVVTVIARRQMSRGNLPAFQTKGVRHGDCA